MYSALPTALSAALAWLKANESLALWLEGLALLLIFFWDRKDHKEDHQETIEQMKVMSRNAVATEMAAKAALDSSKATSRGMEILIARERPRITIKLKDPDFSRAKDIGILFVEYEVECWCPTVAFIVNDRVEAYVADPKALIPKIESPIAVGLPSDVRQTTKFDKGTLVFNTMGNKDVVDEIASGRSVLYFHGQMK